MKIVINIAEPSYEYIKTLDKIGVGKCLIDDVYEAIRQGTPLPDNATNGDVIKAMFPSCSYGTNGNEVHVFGVGGNGVWVFTRDWWNAPYKAESEG